MSNTYTIGHTKPDTDAVVSALAAAHLYNAEECFGHTGAQAVIAGPLNPETSYLFERFGVSAPPILTAETIRPDDRFVLVDHNEETQRAAGIAPEQVVEIIDHHKLNINTGAPIFVTTKTWGSTSTIFSFLMHQYDALPDKPLAALMLAAILSDTVGFKSATTTEQDRKHAQKLAAIAGIDDIDAFTLDIFKAKSDISSLTPEQIVTNDYKIFDFSGKKVLVNQLETVESERIIAEDTETLLSAMASVKARQGVDYMFCAISNILTVNTQLICLSDADAALADAAFGGTLSNPHILDIGPKLSRKKEIAPALEAACKNL